MDKETRRIIEFNENIDVDLNYIYENKITLLANKPDISEKNEKLNENAMEEYNETHVKDVVDENIDVLFALYQGFIAKHINKINSNILDIGCGIGSKYPRYFNMLSTQHRYFGLDPIKVNISDRNYPFLCCGVEDLKKINLKEKFDMALFSSSFDHVEDVSLALDILKGKVDQQVILWVGLHDSYIVASNYGDHYFKHIFNGKNVVDRFLRLLIVFLKGIRLLNLFSRQEKKLINKEDLDSHHFNYFTKNSLFEAIEKHGEIKESLLVPGSNSIFVNLQIK